VVSPDEVVLSHIVGVSASVNLSLHHKVQKFSSGTGSPRWSRKKGRKTVVVCGVWLWCCALCRKISRALYICSVLITVSYRPESEM